MDDRESVRDFAKSKRIPERIMREAAKLAKGPAVPFPGIDVTKEEDLYQLLLVREFFESCGSLFGSEILSYESQHPNLVVDREALSRKFGLDPKDRRPLLEQIVASHKRWMNYEE
jgi:hypothetical protein